MKMVKSLLLGSAAGLFAVAGAQAADLPVKAKPVEYVKVCSLYGAGFYYIPGTDTCIKIGGFVRSEWMHNASGSFATFINGSNATYTRAGDTLRHRARWIVTMDVRSQTEYGTLRAYGRAGWQWTTSDAGATGGSAGAGGSGQTYMDRAFIQFAGFTFGKTASYYDFFCMGCYSLSSVVFAQDTQGIGAHLWAYTAQFGNGVSATLSIEDQYTTRSQVTPVTTAAATFPVATAGTFTPTGSPAATHGFEVPDIVGALRVDQAWGSAQIQGAAHLNQATYYAGANQTAHPDDKWGWAGGAGITLKMPWDPKDTFSIAANYCDGAIKYCTSSSTPGTGVFAGLVNTTTAGVGWTSDAYFNPAVVGSQLENSKAWSMAAAFEHYWTPTLRQSIYGSYLNYEANSAAVDTLVCATVAGVQATGCADWSAYQIGSRILWNPVANLDIGLDVMYSKIESAFSGATIVGLTGAGLPPTLIVGDTDVWSGVVRVQRNFWP